MDDKHGKTPVIERGLEHSARYVHIQPSLKLRR